MEYLTTALAYLREGGIVALTLAILYAGYRRWWVWGWLYDDKTEEAAAWKALALNSTELAEKIVTELRRQKVL